MNQVVRGVIDRSALDGFTDENRAVGVPGKRWGKRVTRVVHAWVEWRRVRRRVTRGGHYFIGVISGRNPVQFESQFVRQLGEYTSEYEDDVSYLQIRIHFQRRVHDNGVLNSNIFLSSRTVFI